MATKKQNKSQSNPRRLFLARIHDLVLARIWVAIAWDSGAPLVLACSDSGSRDEGYRVFILANTDRPTAKRNMHSEVPVEMSAGLLAAGIPNPKPRPQSRPGDQSWVLLAARTISIIMTAVINHLEIF